MSVERAEPRACHFASAAIHPVLQISRMKSVGEIFQAIGKFAELRLQPSAFISSIYIFPTVVQHDMFITEISQTQLNDLVRDSQNQLFGNVATKCVPIILYNITHLVSNLLTDVMGCANKPIPWLVSDLAHCVSR